MNKEKIIEVLKAKFEAENIDMNTRFKEDLKADSIDLYQMVIEIEDEYGISIADEDAMKIETVSDLIDVLEK